MSDVPDRQALKKAANFIRSSLRRYSPSQKAADAWRVEARGDAVFVRNSDIGAWATDQPPHGARHPVFGNREVWANTNKNHPGRENWTRRAVDSAYDTALNAFASEWLDQVALDSKIFDRT
jgi:hypothetical protein